MLYHEQGLKVESMPFMIFVSGFLTNCWANPLYTINISLMVNSKPIKSLMKC